MNFEWNPEKNEVNLKKHGVSFEEATTVFSDEKSVIMPDIAHSYGEERFTVVGVSLKDRLLTVCYCERQHGNIIRIIFARRAENIEKILYERG